MKLIIYGTSFVILSFAAYATGYCPTYFSPAHQKGRIQYRDYRYQANTKIDTAYFNLYNNIYNTLTRILATVTKPQSSLKLAFENFPKKKLTNETLTKFEKIYTYVNDEIQNCFSTYVFSVFGTLDVTPFGAIGPTYIAGIMDLNMNMIVEDFFSRNFCDEPQKHSQNDIILTMSKVRGIIKPFDDKLIATINNLVPRVAERFVNTTAAVNSAIKEISAFTLKINNCTKAASMEDCIKKLVSYILKAAKVRNS